MSLNGGRHKVCLVGKHGVGKSCIVNRLVHDTFTETMASTIAAAYFEKDMSVDGKTVKLCIWDTAGAERFRSLAPMYYRGVDGIILVYDITDESSFQSLSTMWMPTIRAYTDTKVPLVVVGNKLDLERTGGVVPPEQARGYAELLNAAFFQTSAKTGENVDRVFTELALKFRDTKPASSKRLGVQSLDGHEGTPDQSGHGHAHRKCTC